MRKVIGLLMRIYRASPLYPWCGRRLAKLLSYVPRSKEPVVATVNGIVYKLDLREVIDSSLYYSGTFERNGDRIIRSVVRPDMVAVDVGANVGYYGLQLAKLVGPGGTVIGIEPTSYAFEKLKTNLALNPFTNVRLLQVGLAATDVGFVDAQFRSSYRLDGKDELRTERIRLATLDTIIGEQSLTKLDFLKVDVDGFEGKVFAGARGTLARFRPIIFFEFGPEGIRANGDEPIAILTMLFELGYSLQTESGQALPTADSVFGAIPSGSREVNLLALPGAAL